MLFLQKNIILQRSLCAENLAHRTAQRILARKPDAGRRAVQQKRVQINAFMVGLLYYYMCMGCAVIGVAVECAMSCSLFIVCL